MLRTKRFAHTVIGGAHLMAHDAKATIELMVRDPGAAEAKILQKLHI